MNVTVRWILLRIIFRTVCKLHMYVLLKYEPTVRKHKKSSLTFIFVNSEFESCTLSTSVLIHDSDAKTTAFILGIPLLKLCTWTIIYIYKKCESSGNFFSILNLCNNIHAIIRNLVLSVCVHYCCFFIAKASILYYRLHVFKKVKKQFK